MRQRSVRIVIEKADWAALQRGGLLTIALAAGQSVELELDRTAKNGHKAPNSTTKSWKASGLTSVRGDCPYCPSKGIYLATHIRATHPGKVIPYTGAGFTCLHCAQRFPTAHGAMRHMVVTHKKNKIDMSKLKHEEGKK